jgi:glycerophosphoryl diester phosphodiesterase
MTTVLPATLILGHRGAPHQAPENTIAGFALALAAGCDGVELDVQRSRDGVPVVIHDDSLDRTGHGRGLVADRSWAELSILRGAGEPIPSLAQAIGWASDAGAWLNVEIKATDVTAATLQALRNAGFVEGAIISSFHPRVIAEVGRLGPEFKRFLLLDSWSDDALTQVRACMAQGVCLHVDAATPGTVAELAAADLPLVVWTVDQPDRLAHLLQAGVAGVITNRPEIAVPLRR